MKKYAAVLVALFMLAGCARTGQKKQVFSYTGPFDTVVTLTVYASAFSPAAFEAYLTRLDAIFDRYEATPEISGLYALNHAAGAWVEVEDELYCLLERCLEYYGRFEKRTNIMLGNVTALWKMYREEGTALPSAQALQTAAAHTDFSALELDGNGRARITDAHAAIDLGSVAKGYSVELLANMLAKTVRGFLIDTGGNVRAGGSPQNGRESWLVGVQDPFDAQNIICKINLLNMSAVTSGGYQRYYVVDGVRYHHLIDPDTLMPGNYVEQVTILAKDSGLADYLSTEAFLMPYATSRALVDSLDGVEAIWVFLDGTVAMTDGAKTMLAGE